MLPFGEKKTSHEFRISQQCRSDASNVSFQGENEWSKALWQSPAEEIEGFWGGFISLFQVLLKSIE